MSKILNKIIYGYVVLETVDSKTNTKIEVREDLFGRRSMVVGGLFQSGPVVEKIWQKVISGISNQKSVISSCLILGLGAGTAAKLVSQTFPDCKITGIEIDPEVIRIGKKYFGLDEIKNLNVVLNDAISLVTNHKSLITNYGLILVDLYLGDQFPAEAEKEEFLLSLRKIVSQKGIIIFNRLYHNDQKKRETDEFSKKINSIFSQVEEYKISCNKFFLLD